MKNRIKELEIPDNVDQELKSAIVMTYEIMVTHGIYERTWNPEKNKYVYILTDLGVKLENQKS